MSCVRNCPGALSKESTVKLEIAGRTVEFSELQHDKCLEGIRGNNGNNPFKQGYPSYYGYGCAIEAGKGCLRACYAHLESKGVLKKKFHERFRKGKMWSVNLDEERPLSQHIIDDYISKGKIEEDKPVQKKDADSKNKKIHGNKIADPWS